MTFAFLKLKKQKFNSYILTLSENEEIKKTSKENALSSRVNDLFHKRFLNVE